MRVIGPSSEDEMVALFLRGELASERFGRTIRQALRAEGADPTLLEAPALHDADANGVRHRLLAVTRAYGRDEGLFSGFPADVRWERVLLGEDDLAALRYIDYDYWVELSGGSRRVADGAPNAQAGAAPFGVPSDGFLELASAIAAGARVPEPILVTAGPDDPVVVLEGHVRVTAYALAGIAVGEALLGTSPAMRRWALY